MDNCQVDPKAWLGARGYNPAGDLCEVIRNERTRMVVNTYFESSADDDDGGLGVTAMFEAAFEGQLSVCKFVLNQGGVASFRHDDDMVLSPFRGALRAGHFDVAEYLCAVGGFSKHDNVNDFLRMVCLDGDLNKAQWLVKQGATVECSCAFLFSIANRHLDVAQWMLDIKLALIDDLRDIGHMPGGESALTYACKMDHLDVVIWMYVKNSDLDYFKATDELGCTPLRAACNNYSVDTALWLLEMGAANGEDGHVSSTIVLNDIAEGVRSLMLLKLSNIITAHDNFAYLVLPALLLGDDHPLSGHGETVAAHIANFVGVMRERRLRNIREVAVVLAPKVTGPTDEPAATMIMAAHLLQQLAPASMVTVRINRSTSTIPLGITITSCDKNARLMQIKSVTPGTPAALAGVRKRDLLVTVDWNALDDGCSGCAGCAFLASAPDFRVGCAMLKYLPPRFNLTLVRPSPLLPIGSASLPEAPEAATGGGNCGGIGGGGGGGGDDDDDKSIDSDSDSIRNDMTASESEGSGDDSGNDNIGSNSFSDEKEDDEANDAATSAGFSQLTARLGGLLPTDPTIMPAPAPNPTTSLTEKERADSRAKANAEQARTDMVAAAATAPADPARCSSAAQILGLQLFDEIFKTTEKKEPTTDQAAGDAETKFECTEQVAAVAADEAASEKERPDNQAKDDAAVGQFNLIMIGQRAKLLVLFFALFVAYVCRW